jgi:hypothetical protein
MDGVDPLLEGGEHPQGAIALSGVFQRLLEVDALDQNRLWNQRRRRLPGYCIRDSGCSERRLIWLLWLAIGGVFRQLLDFRALERDRPSD